MEEMFDKIKEQAYKAKDGAVKLTKTVIGKTNNVVSQTKVKFAIGETEDKIKEIYCEMGKTAYERYKDSGNCCDGVAEKCSKIDVLMDELNELKEQLAELKETVKCPNCGGYNHTEDAYCSKCGGKLQNDIDIYDEEEQTVTITAKRPETDED